MEKKAIKNQNLMFASFLMDRTEIALPISALQEVVNLPSKISRVPLSPPYLVGLFNLRGSVIPIVHIAKLLGLSMGEDETQRKVAIVHSQGTKIGLLFDSTSEILQVPENEISQFEHQLDKRKILLGALNLNGGDRIVEIVDPSALVNIENIHTVLEGSDKIKIDIRKKSTRIQCITFISQEERFAFNISAISEIVRVPDIQNQYSRFCHSID
jgi:purine-binding chemotaxis protein CheW